MKIKVKDSNGRIFSNDTSLEIGIVEVHFSTSYTQVIVRDKKYDEENGETFINKNIIIPTKTKNILAQANDLIAVESDEIGEWA